MARVSADYRANCLSPPTKAAVQIINLIVDFIVAFVTMSHAARPSLVVVADAASNGVGDGIKNSDFTDGRPSSFQLGGRLHFALIRKPLEPVRAVAAKVLRPERLHTKKIIKSSG